MRLVLVGCGHGHVEVVRRFALYPEPELVLTLISTSPLETCFGKLPGLVAGHYGPAERHIDRAFMSRYVSPGERVAVHLQHGRGIE